ncbi:MAG: hypothetical protein WCY11_03740 [Novosphingobium sp.]
MPIFVLAVDVMGIILAIVGFNMAFRQQRARKLLGLPRAPDRLPDDRGHGQDPVTYALRIGGVMAMVFGIALAGLITLANIALG